MMAKTYVILPRTVDDSAWEPLRDGAAFATLDCLIVYGHVLVSGRYRANVCHQSPRLVSSHGTTFGQIACSRSPS